MAQKLSDILKEVQAQAVATSVHVQDTISPRRGPVVTPPRGIASPQDATTTDSDYVSPFRDFAPGTRRPMWLVPEIAVTHTPVNTLQSAGTTSSTSQAQIIGGVVSGVKAPISGWATVPNMEASVVANGPVHITATLSVQSNIANDSVQFAFYRQGQQLSQAFTHTTPSTNNTPSLVNLSMIDEQPLVRGLKTNLVYSLYWKAGTGTLTATGVGRSMYLMSLVPQ